MKRPLVYLLIAIVTASTGATLYFLWDRLERANSIKLGPSEAFKAGPTGFKAHKLFLGRRQIGYASSFPKPLQVSEDAWVYLSCEITKPDPGFDGECKDWKMINVRTSAVVTLNLPGLIPFWAYPTFSWPKVAYVQVGRQSSSQGKHTVHCVLYDYEKKKMVQRQRKIVPAEVFGNDVGGAFLPPVLVSRKTGADIYRFSYTSDGESESILCELAAAA